MFIFNTAYYWKEIVCWIWGSRSVVCGGYGLLSCNGCSPEKARSFGGTYCLHLQGRRASQGRNHQRKQAESRAFFLTQRRSSCPGRVKNFLFSTSSRPALGPTQPPIQWVPGVKWQGSETDHSTPVSAEVKKMWIYISTPPYAFMA
jgi:hypothetical protein